MAYDILAVEVMAELQSHGDAKLIMSFNKALSSNHDCYYTIS